MLNAYFIEVARLAGKLLMIDFFRSPAFSKIAETDGRQWHEYEGGICPNWRHPRSLIIGQPLEEKTTLIRNRLLIGKLRAPY